MEKRLIINHREKEPFSRWADTFSLVFFLVDSRNSPWICWANPSALSNFTLSNFVNFPEFFLFRFCETFI